MSRHDRRAIMELSEQQKCLIKKIKRLKKEKQAVILCHNYQRPEIYEVADFIGDSLELCRKAQESKARMIVFAGVYFMAESAAILTAQTGYNPGCAINKKKCPAMAGQPYSTKKVIIPNKDAGCALADMITAEALLLEKKKYPGAAVVCYVNSSAEVKAESDICCTSANAVKVVESLPNKQIIFVPDKNLAKFVARQVPGKEIIAWDGYCPIHQRLSKEYLLEAKKYHPDAKIIAHPECIDEVREIADYVVSTSGMVKVAKESDANEFICTTECGMLQRIMREVPGKKFYTVCSACFNMKKITLESIAEALEKEQFEVVIAEAIRKKAFRAFERMFSVT